MAIGIALVLMALIVVVVRIVLLYRVAAAMPRVMTILIAAIGVIVTIAVPGWLIVLIGIAAIVVVGSMGADQLPRNA